MFRRAGTLSFVLVAILMSAVCAQAQDEPIEPRILKPVGKPTSPVLLKVPSVATTYSSPTATEVAGSLPGLPITSQITFREFMRQVEKANLALAAQRYNVTIAEAQLTAASVYPDPAFQAGYGGDVSGNRQATTYAGSVGETFLLGGKIRTREEAAGAVLRASNAALSDYLRTLRGQAADAFIDGLIGLLKLRRGEKSLQRARQLVELKIKRLRNREISEDGLMRARIAELEAHSNLADSQSALHQSLGGLAIFMGASLSDGLIAPSGNLEGEDPTFSLAELKEKAITSRSDVMAAQYTLETARGLQSSQGESHPGRYDLR
jgi:cobalt-zinc-cadmium efflux system outer membrane protein